ncbi:putative membrane protein [Methanonatronarchaeum thermophilum]|uniref:Putative membrane protein n=1 Tax=Methanonatronarchaeum thermophilum TaxID=1927129 RepID=A0A1Y3GA16_9EURY|nr:TIGR00341 family protein [Methanonatronarchaeum thermophilum]OUJ18268.1 putative membrane protein [Methanonatronarchaeum thermophilum]
MTFRTIEVKVPSEMRERVLSVLDEKVVERSSVLRTESGDVLVRALVPKEKVEEVTEALWKVGVEKEGWVSVTSVEVFLSEEAEDIKEEAREEEEDRISRDELKAKTSEMAKLTPTYLVLTIVSSVIATCGILLNSTAVVVGSMVIAPLIGPAVASGVGTVLADRGLFREAIVSEVMGVLVAVVSSAVFAWLAFKFNLVSPIYEPLLVDEIVERIYPTFLSIAIAVGSGVAGALSLTAGLNTALVGVMIAVALIPPASVAGIGIALGDPLIAVGASVLLVINVLFLNLAGTFTLRFEGYLPSEYYKQVWVKRDLVRVSIVYVVLIAIASTVVVGVSYDMYTNDAFEGEVQEVVEDVLAGYGEVTFRGIEFQYESYYIMFEEPVSTTISIYSTAPPPDNLKMELEELIYMETGKELEITVEVIQRI